MDFFRNHIPHPYSTLFTYMVFALYWLSKSPGDHTPGAVDGFFANVGLYKRLEPLRTSASTGIVEPNLQTPRGPLASSLNLTDLGWCVLGREMLGETLFTLKPTRVENSVRKNADPEVSTPIVLLRCGVPRALGRCQDHLGLYMASTLGGGQTEPRRPGRPPGSLCSARISPQVVFLFATPHKYTKRITSRSPSSRFILVSLPTMGGLAVLLRALLT